MSNIYNDVERIVAKIVGEKSGNAFLIDERRVVTVKHCIVDPKEKVKLVFLKLHEGEIIEREAIVYDQFQYLEDEWVLLKLEEELDASGIKFASMGMQPFDEASVYGYDANFPVTGNWTKLQSTGSTIHNTEFLQDMQFSPTDSKEKDFSGLSGSPIIKGNFIIGIVSQETLENGQAISIHGISVKSSMEFFEKYNIEVEDLTDIGEYSFESSMSIGNEKRSGKGIAIGGEQEIQNRLHGIYKDRLTNIVIQHRRGDVNGAWEELKNQLVEIEKDSFVGNDVKAEYHYRMALWLLEDRGDLIKARKRYENAKRLNPELDDTIFRVLMAHKIGENQNIEEMLEPVDSVAKFNVYLQVCINTQKYEKAYDKFLEVEPILSFDSSTYYLLSVLNVLLRKFDEADNFINHAIELDKKVPFYHLIKGIISYWRAVPEDMFYVEDLYPLMFINGLLHLNVEQQKMIKDAASDYSIAYRLAETVENQEQMDFILGVWGNSLSVDSVFQNDIMEPLQLLKARDPFNVTVLLYSLQKGIALDEIVTIDSLEQHVKKSKNKLGHVVALVELCLSKEEYKRAKSILHEYRAIYFNEEQYGHWYEAIVKVEEDKDKLREYEKEITTNVKLDEIQRKQLLALLMQLDSDRDEELEILIKEIYEQTGARVDLLNLIFFYKTRRKWKSMQQSAEILLNKYGDIFGSMYKIQSLIEQQEYEQALCVIEDVKEKAIAGTEIELLRNQMHIYERMGRYAEAIDSGSELLKKKPTAQNIMNLASLYALNGDEGATLSTLLKAEEYTLLTTTICQRISNCYLTIDSNKAWEYAKKAVRLSNEQPEIMLWAHSIAERVGKSEEGATYLHRVMLDQTNHQLLMMKDLDEVLELHREWSEEAQKNLQLLYDGELTSHLFVDYRRNQTYAEFFYAQWNYGDVAPMEFGAHYYHDSQINTNMKKLVIDYSSCLFLHEMGLLELLCDGMEKVYIAGDLFGVMSEEIRNIPEVQPNYIKSRYQLVQKCKNEHHIEFVEVKRPNDLNGLNAKQTADKISAYTAECNNALWVSEDKVEGAIQESEVIVALYRCGKISKDTFEKYSVAENIICENNVQRLLHQSPKLLVEEVVITKWDEFSLLPVIASNFILLAENIMEQDAEQRMIQMENKNHICKQLEQLKLVLQKYNEQGKIGFIPIGERNSCVYSNMLATILTAAENKGIPICVDDRVITSYSSIGKAPIYNSFDLTKMMFLQKKITLEKYFELWGVVFEKKIRYVLPDNYIILHALLLSEIDENKRLLKESEMLCKIRQYVVEALSVKSSLSSKQVAHVHIPEREYFTFRLQSNSRELLRLVWISEMNHAKKRIVSNWILRHYSQFAFDFGNKVNGSGRVASHAIQLADFLIAGILLTSDEIRAKEYYRWLYDWIAMYLAQNPEIKEKMLNYAREFIGSYLRDSARSADKKEYAVIKQMFAAGIYYMPEEYQEQMLKDSTISQVFHRTYSQISVVLTQARHVPAEVFKSWESEVLTMDEKVILSKSYGDVDFQFSWEYIVPAFPGIIVKWQEGTDTFERRIFLNFGARLKHESKNVRKQELKQIEEYLETVDYGKANIELLSSKYEKAADEILSILSLSKEFERTRIKKGLEENWYGNEDAWKYLLPVNPDFFRQFYNFDVQNTALIDSVAETLPIELGKLAKEALFDNHNPVRLLHQLSRHLESETENELIVSIINSLLTYVISPEIKYGKTYILLLRCTYGLFGEIDIYRREKIENLQIWAYIWTDMIMTELSQLVEEGKIDLDTFVSKLQKDMNISYETDGVWDDIEEEDILSPLYMNLYRLCVTGTLAICWIHKERILHMAKDILTILDNCYKSWLGTAMHICESELYHKSETNVHQAVFNENAYELIGYLADSCNCTDIFANWEVYGIVKNRRQYLLKGISEDNGFELGELLYLAIMARECVPEDDVVLLQRLVEKKVLEQSFVLEEKRYALLIYIVNRLSQEFQDKFIQHEFARIGIMLRESKIEWMLAENIVTEIAAFKGIEKYLDFWEAYEDALNETDALQLAEKIGWMQYRVPYEQAGRMRELRIRLELKR